jgi:acetate kinase
MIDAVGHRVVHGGDLFSQSVRMSSEVVNEIERWNDLAPLHNPASLAAIREAIVFFGDAMPMVAAFDTAFYHGMPRRARMYAIPTEMAEKHHIQRYGFHGIAHASLAAGYAKVSGQSLDTARIITVHLGNGCSATAVSGGKALDTSMGFTPLEGLIMGTRSGDCDPSIVGYLADKEQVSHKEVERWLNEQSGLLGISGISNQMDVLLEAATADRESPAELAIDMFCYRIRKYVGAYLGALGGADAIVFGGGIGERAPEIRARVCYGMDWCGLHLDERRNRSAVELAPGEGMCISRDDARLEAYVVAADEEAYIASETVRCVQAG